jgi:hypothetical protein
MIELFDKIYERLKTRLGDALWIDIWNNQVENQDNKYPLFLPAVFVEISLIDYSRIKRGIQEGKTNIVLHVCQNHIGVDTHEGAKVVSREYLVFVNQVYLAMQDLKGDTFSQLERKQFQQTKTINTVIQHDLVFTTIIQDRTKLDEYESELIPFTPDIQPERII